MDELVQGAGNGHYRFPGTDIIAVAERMHADFVSGGLPQTVQLVFDIQALLLGRQHIGAGLEVKETDLFFQQHQLVEQFVGPIPVGVVARAKLEGGQRFVDSAEHRVVPLKHLAQGRHIVSGIFQGHFTAPEIDIAPVAPANFMNRDIEGL